MTKILKKVQLCTEQSTSKNADPTRGTQTNPYTQVEMTQLQEEGTWKGGYVEGMGLVPMMMMFDSSLGSDGGPLYLEELLNQLPISVKIHLPSNIQYVYTTTAALGGDPGQYNSENNTLYYTSNSYIVFYRECIHAVQTNIGINSHPKAASEFQEHIIGDIRLYISSLNNNNSPLNFSTFFGVYELSEYSILSSFINGN